MMTDKHKLEELIENLQRRDNLMLSEINGMFGGGMTLENRLALADARATDALAALCVLARHIVELEKNIDEQKGSA